MFPVGSVVRSSQEEDVDLPRLGSCDLVRCPCGSSCKSVKRYKVKCPKWGGGGLKTLAVAPRMFGGCHFKEIKEMFHLIFPVVGRH